MSEIFPVPPSFQKKTWCDEKTYREMYRRSLEDTEGFWAEQAKRIQWMKPWTKIKDTSFQGDVHIQWYKGAKLNVSVNCIDRHLPQRANQTALIWEADDPKTPHKTITYQQLHDEVCRFANVLKSGGVKKGDRVTIYMPMILEAAYAMLACSRIGAVLNAPDHRNSARATALQISRPTRAAQSRVCAFY